MAPPIFVRSAFAFLLGTLACEVFQDNATHLAYVLESGAKELRSSGRTVDTVYYDRIHARDLPYDVTVSNDGITVSEGLCNYRPECGSTFYTISNTTYHRNFLSVRGQFAFHKERGLVRVILAKGRNGIEVIDVR